MKQIPSSYKEEIMKKQVIGMRNGETFYNDDSVYGIHQPRNGWTPLEDITDDERVYLRPIAETLAILDGNAFFILVVDYYDRPRGVWESYLPEAKAIFDANGGLNGAAGDASFVKEFKEKKHV